MRPGQARNVAVIGGGLIGMSWASLFLARGANVVVVDPRPEVQAALNEFISRAWPLLNSMGLATQAEAAEAQFRLELGDLSDVDFVQENGPDRIEVKRAIVAELEQAIAADVVIASSTSSLRPSDLQIGASHPERILVGHPMNPPHMVPMVELVAGRMTSSEAMDKAEDFYTQMDRVVIRVKKEVTGHLANRLTSALYREAVYLVAEGIADVRDIDKAITYGPGLRWALLGPHLTYHLGGGRGGYRQYLDHLGPTQEARWKELGESSLSEELKQILVAGIEQELLEQDQDSLVQRRDQALLELLQIKKKFGF